MKLNDLIEKGIFYISVPKCVSCGARLDFGSNVFCDTCLEEFHSALTRNCSRCSKPLHQCSCSNKHLKSKGVKQVIKLFRYIQREENYTANSLIYSLKKDNRKDVIKFITAMLAEAFYNLIGDPSGFVFTNVPRRRTAIIKRGFDHAALLSKSLAKEFNAEYISMFKSKARSAQKELRGIARHKNAVFSITKNVDLSGKTVVIVDDVITTGSSVGAVAELAKKLGARKIIAASIGIAYKDEYEAPIL